MQCARRPAPAPSNPQPTDRLCVVMIEHDLGGVGAKGQRKGDVTDSKAAFRKIAVGNDAKARAGPAVLRRKEAL